MKGLEQIGQLIKKNQLLKEKGLAARQYQNNLIKPKGSLGVLEDISVRLAEMTGQIQYNIHRKDVVIFSGDHGITDYALSVYPKEVTQHMTANYINGGAGGSVIARANQCELTVVDVGIAGDFQLPGLLNHKVREGTRDFTQGPAMTLMETVQAIDVGIKVTEDLIQSGSQIIAPGEMGIGNTTSSSALLVVFGGYSPEEVVGRGTLINDQTVQRKIEIVKRGLAINQPTRKEPVEVLAKLGGYEIAATVGVFLACALHRMPVVVDGFISGTAAIIAESIAPGAKNFMFALHLSAEPGHQRILEILGLQPFFNFGMRLGEATGAILAMQIIQTASKVIGEMATFSSGGVALADKSIQLVEK